MKCFILISMLISLTFSQILEPVDGTKWIYDIKESATCPGFHSRFVTYQRKIEADPAQLYTCRDLGEITTQTGWSPPVTEEIYTVYSFSMIDSNNASVTVTCPITDQHTIALYTLFQKPLHDINELSIVKDCAIDGTKYTFYIYTSISNDGITKESYIWCTKRGLMQYSKIDETVNFSSTTKINKVITLTTYNDELIAIESIKKAIEKAQDTQAGFYTKERKEQITTRIQNNQLCIYSPTPITGVTLFSLSGKELYTTQGSNLTSIPLLKLAPGNVIMQMTTLGKKKFIPITIH